jgi:ParB family transcriptional regulator, chromosome partitioning protein
MTRRPTPPTDVTLGTAPLAELHDAQASTRRIDWAQVDALFKSIRAVGMIDPLVISSTGAVLCGVHRLASLRRLARMDPVTFASYFPLGRVPVGIMPPSAHEAAARAEVQLQRKFTEHDVQLLTARLRAAGFRDRAGRPRAGEEALGPALRLVLGASRRTVARILARGAAPRP